MNVDARRTLGDRLDDLLDLDDLFDFDDLFDLDDLLGLNSDFLGDDLLNDLFYCDFLFNDLFYRDFLLDNLLNRDDLRFAAGRQRGCPDATSQAGQAGPENEPPTYARRLHHVQPPLEAHQLAASTTAIGYRMHSHNAMRAASG